MRSIVSDEGAWADFFITKLGFIIFAAVLLLCAFKVYPMFKEQQERAGLDAAASGIASKIEAVGSVTVPGYRYVHSFDEMDKNIEIGISTEYVTAQMNISTTWGERKLVHAEPVVARVYPPNSNWSNTSGLRRKLSDIGLGRNGDIVSPLDFSEDKDAVDGMFSHVEHELSHDPFVPDMNRSLIIEKVIIHYTDGNRSVKRDYVLVYQ